MKHAVVTGGGSGIGRSLTGLLVAKGYQVTICGRSRTALEQAALQWGSSVSFVVCDLASHAGRALLVEAVSQQAEPVDLLVNNAGIQFECDFGASSNQDIDMQNIQGEVDVNLVGPISLIAALLPTLRRPGASIVNITSILAIHPKRSAPVYCATKAGLRSFTRALRHQLRALGISVVEAIPPLVDTPMTAGRGKRKISADQAAAQIIAGLEKRDPEIHIGASRPLIWFNRIVPSLVARLLIKG